MELEKTTTGFLLGAAICFLIALIATGTEYEAWAQTFWTGALVFTFAAIPAQYLSTADKKSKYKDASECERKRKEDRSNIARAENLNGDNYMFSPKYMETFKLDQNNCNSSSSCLDAKAKVIEAIKHADDGPEGRGAWIEAKSAARDICNIPNVTPGHQPVVVKGAGASW